MGPHLSDPSGELFKFSQNLFITLHCHGTVHRDAVKCFQLIARGEACGFHSDDLFCLLHGAAELGFRDWVEAPGELGAGGAGLLTGQKGAVDCGRRPREGLSLLLASVHTHRSKEVSKEEDRDAVFLSDSPVEGTGCLLIAAQKLRAVSILQSTFRQQLACMVTTGTDVTRISLQKKTQKAGVEQKSGKFLWITIHIAVSGNRDKLRWVPECYIRSSAIKQQLPEEIIYMVKGRRRQGLWPWWLQQQKGSGEGAAVQGGIPGTGRDQLEKQRGRQTFPKALPN
ncbi:hypothetical protein Celaphus_00009252 [Cervus elaphus hippelaphus]|uniref:Uncharacterized protein n=1 Tax=Cervus elaphus hippelaphus TaxID=46360 RepID=A0A212DIV8_CEREH|nr:hypothetical protein Celaphus_00009252 [Cervus elaphus hippelaphus]